jgi:hypothetical protein
MGTASVMPGLPALPQPYSPSAPAPVPFTGTAVLPDPEVWLIATATANGSMRPLEGFNRPGAIRVERPYGHLRAVRPVPPPSEIEDAPAPRARKGRGASSNLPAARPAPAIISAVEVETDAGIFRVQRPQSVLGHSDLAWALANLEAGEPDALVPLPRRQLALLLTLLPTPEDPEHPENDPTWGWAHRLKGPWERGPLHTRGRLGRLISIDPDPTGRGMHRACFELLGSDEVVWALGVPCFRTGSVYELVPLSKSRFMNWPLVKTRAKGTIERPAWEISRVVYRVGSPRWPLAGVVEPLGPIGTAG